MNISNRPTTVIGLGTWSFPINTSGSKSVKGKITLPGIEQGDGANSQVVVTMNLNGGSAFYTGNPGDRGFDGGTYANPGDVINVILTSSLPSDNALEAVKTTFSIN